MGNYISGSNLLSEASSPPPPSPELCGITQLTDEVIPHHYIEFPEDTIFMESLSYNPQWNSNNGSNFAYVPVQRFVNGGTESHIYTIQPNIEEAVHWLGPLAAVDEYGPTTDVTVFGSALSHDGILYVCAFNRNTILAYDLLHQPDSDFALPLFEIPNIWAPNDISIDPDDPSVLYVAGGSLKRLFRDCHGQDTEKCLQYSNPVDGAIYKITLTDTATSSNNVKEATVTILQKDLLTLAGIEVSKGLVWTAQLFNMFVIPASNDATTRSLQIIWQGDDNSGTSKAILDDVVWLADNVDTADFGNGYLVSPAFSTQGEILVDVGLKSSFLATLGNFAAQIVTKFSQRESLPEALLDPEVDLCFSNTYIREGVDPEPIRLFFLAENSHMDDPTTTMNSCDNVHHFEIDLVETRQNYPPREIVDPRTKKVLGMRHFFNEQVTHTAHLQDINLGGYLALVNFEQLRILMLDDTIFRLVLAA